MSSVLKGLSCFKDDVVRVTVRVQGGEWNVCAGDDDMAKLEETRRRELAWAGLISSAPLSIADSIVTMYAAVFRRRAYFVVSMIHAHALQGDILLNLRCCVNRKMSDVTKSSQKTLLYQA